MMRQSLERAEAETTGAKVYLLACYYLLANNMSLVTVLFGLCLMGFGATVLSGRPRVLFEVVEPLNVLTHGVFAAMFGVWGGTMVVIGGIAYGILWANKLFARIQTDSASDADSELESL